MAKNWEGKIVWGKDEYNKHDTPRPAVVRKDDGSKEIGCKTLSSSSVHSNGNFVQGTRGTQGWESEKPVTRNKDQVRFDGEFEKK